jgi:NAD(P)-dependent dehydrogenase (short-subunit alcohol dehydrogenase family)
MNHRFAGQVVVITGAASGIGAAAARRFAAEGASLVLADLNEAEGQRLTLELSTQQSPVSFVRTDVSDPDQVEALMQTAVERHGALNVVFNNAGIRSSTGAALPSPGCERQVAARSSTQLPSPASSVITDWQPTTPPRVASST